MAYRRIDTKMWDDEKFIGFSLPTKLFWCFILTGPQTTALPGLYVAGLGTLMDAFRDEEGTIASAALGELQANNLVEVDRTLRVIRIPNAPSFNEPSFPNQIVSWWNLFNSVPDSPLKWLHVPALKAAISDGSDTAPGMRLAWNKTFGTLPPDKLPAGFAVRFPIEPTSKPASKGRPKEPSKPASNGDQRATQDLSQSQDLDQSQEHPSATRSGGPRPAPRQPAPPPPPPPPPTGKNGDTLPWKGAPETGAEQQAVLEGLWKTYRDTFDPEGKQANGKAYHFQIHGDALSRALRSEPLCDHDDPVHALRLAYDGFRTNKLRMGEGKLGNRLFHQLLRADALVGAIDRGLAQTRGVNPDVMPAPEREMPPPPPTEPREGYYEEPAPAGADAGPDDPAARRKHIQDLIDKAKKKPDDKGPK